MSTKKIRILVAPLNWGLGHATRMIPVIEQAVSAGHHVVIASDGLALGFLQKQFPALPCYELPALSLRYGSQRAFSLVMMLQIPRIVRWIRDDYIAFRKITTRDQFDLVISDNRWGIHTRSARCIFVSHQLWIKLPFMIKVLEPLLCLSQRLLLFPYDEFWVPDYQSEEVSLSGRLSHRAVLYRNATFIGPLSRFSRPISLPPMTYDVAVILSGVESQRTIIEEILFNRFSRTTLRVAFVRGTDTTPAVSASNITVFGICGTADLHDIILSSRLVVCRSGYSSVMDLIALGAKALLIPTPGQTEQEYLARYLSSRGWFASVSQQDVTSLSDDDMFALVARTRPHPLVAHSNGVIFFR